MEQTTVVSVKFKDGYRNRTYSYLCDEQVKVGQMVVVESPYDGFTCATVVEINPADAAKASKWIVQAVDTSRYKERAQRNKRIAELKGKLKQRSKEISELNFFKRLAEDDPASKELVEELEKLTT